MSRNAPPSQSGLRSLRLIYLAAILFLPWVVAAGDAPALSLVSATNSTASVVVVTDGRATEAFRPRPEVVETMWERGLFALTDQTNFTAAWATLISTQDVIGLKVYSRPGANSGTRPAVVAAIAKSLLAAGVFKTNILIWDREESDLRDAGYFRLAQHLGIRVVGAAQTGWDETNYYDSPIIGSLVYGDLEFGRKEDGVGRKSYVSKLISQQLTKIINITPLLNHTDAGVCGNLYSLAFGSTDNILRFEGNAARLATAVPEIYALPALYDRVVLNVTDALICQYEGGERLLLHYSAMLNQLRLSCDPVALDVLSLRELETQRRKVKAVNLRPNLELYRNAALIDLGVGEISRVNIEPISN